MTLPLILSPEVREAKAGGQAVVALESTIITHGMPFPQNVETAALVEEDIRAGGAVPATIAVMGGRIHVGLTADELEKLGRATGVMKLSRADLAVCLAAGGVGATTVAATMICAQLAGISVFATGGIGGVHRGAGDTFDISADLTELSRTPVAVVSAGAKAILDLPLTLEWLETLSVPVVGYGTAEFPAFYSRSSGLPLHIRCDTPEEVAGLLAAQWQLGSAGVLVANPIPAEHEIQAEEIAPVITDAVHEAQRRQVVGKAVTPFLLARLAEVTAGRSLASNIALVKNNARVAARIARMLP